MYYTLAILGIFALFYSAVGARLQKTPVSGPVVYLLFGLLCGPLGLGVFTGDIDSETLRLIAELTLAIVLFLDATTADLSVLKRITSIPMRMLLVGLPLAILLGFMSAYLIFPSLPLLELAILATMLAPTDAALGKAVVSNNNVPIELRESLKAESGINDGICVPVLLALLALTLNTSVETSPASLILKFFLTELGIGLVVGLGLTLVSSFMLKASHERGWISGFWMYIPLVALALACFATAQALHGSGFIAAFAGGLLFGALNRTAKHQLVENSESVGEVAAMLTWIAFGAAVVRWAILHFSWEMIVYAVLSLTIVRMLPIYISLTGLGLTPHIKLFLGWFGPRGLASIVFAIVVFHSHLPNSEVLAATVAWTVILSVFLHGISAVPLSADLERCLAKDSLNMEPPCE